MIKRYIIVLTLLLATYQLDNGLGKTPQMGWNSWNHYACDGLNQEVVKQTAKTIATNGFKELGFNYINLDDCWAESRNPTTGEIIPDLQKFPDGIAALADYVHSLGLKFGLYSCAGSKTCAGRPGSLGYEFIDARTYASWGVDYLKYDNCFNENIPSKYRYEVMYQALMDVDRPIFYSMCNWGHEFPWLWAAPIANSWRTTYDIKDIFVEVESIIELQKPLYKYAGPGHWNDPDMLEVGNKGMTVHQQQIQMAIWSLLKAPLIIGCDVTNMTQDTINILGNTEVIAVNQDLLGKQGVYLYESKTGGHHHVWGIPLEDKSTVIIVWNVSDKEGTFQVSVSDLQQHFEKVDYPFDLSGQINARDIINKTNIGQFTDVITTSPIDKKYIQMLKLSNVSNQQLIE